jgi:hypothetical protein
MLYCLALVNLYSCIGSVKILPTHQYCTSGSVEVLRRRIGASQFELEIEWHTCSSSVLHECTEFFCEYRWVFYYRNISTYIMCHLQPGAFLSVGLFLLQRVEVICTVIWYWIITCWFMGNVFSQFEFWYKRYYVLCESSTSTCYKRNFIHAKEWYCANWVASYMLKNEAYVEDELLNGLS